MDGLVSGLARTTGLTVGQRRTEAPGGGGRTRGRLLHGQVMPSRDIGLPQELLIRFSLGSIGLHDATAEALTKSVDGLYYGAPA